jgi:diguanylate cyclase (GGDEF)-like protein
VISAFRPRPVPGRVLTPRVGVPWQVPAAVVPPAAVAVGLLPPGPVRLAGWAVLALGCATTVLTGRWAGRGRPWRWLGVGLLLMAASGVLAVPTFVAGTVLAVPRDGVSPALLVHLLAYLPLLVGVLGLTEGGARRVDRWVALDAVIVVCVVVAVALLVVADGRPDGLPLLVLPVLDVVVLVCAVPLLAPGGRGPAQALVVAGLLCVLVADTLLLLGASLDVPVLAPAGAVLLVALLLLAVAARHPSADLLAAVAARRTRAEEETRTRPPVSTRRLLLLGVGLLAAPLLLLVGILGMLPDSARPALVLAFTVFALAAVRLAQLVAELVRHEAETDAHRRFSAAFDGSPGGLGLVAVSGPDAGCLVEVNASLCHLLGRPARELVGTPVTSLVHPDDPDGERQVRLALDQVARRRAATSPAAPGAVTARLAAPGRPRWGTLDLAPLAGGPERVGADGLAVLQVDDITGHVDTEAQLAAQARRDPLTGLSNRLDLIEGLAAAIADHDAGGRPVALLLLDLDRFKLVNDAHGHAVGDELLVDVAGRLSRLRTDLVARLGGDEFAVLTRSGDDARLEALLRRVHAVLEPVVPLSRGDVVVSASIGVVVHDARGRTGPGTADAEGLLRQADIAMYRAKAGGGHRHVVFGEALQADVDNRHLVERELRTALTSGGLSVVYQPVVDLADGRVVGHEALVRLVRRVQGVTVGPSEFLEVAEESGLVTGMGGFVMSTAVGTAVRDPLGRRMAVNVSGRELAEPDFAGRVLRRVHRAGLAPHRLTVEVTESAVVPYLDDVVPQLSLLRREGVVVALDDFGTGYSSLTHLRALPVDVVKIDRSFVERVVVDGPDRRIVAAVAELVNGLGLDTVAEGIETRAQHEVVRLLGCRYGQGYLYGRPAAALAGATTHPWSPSAPEPAAPVAQPAEAGALKAQQYGFESRRGHRRRGEEAATMPLTREAPAGDGPDR